MVCLRRIRDGQLRMERFDLAGGRRKGREFDRAVLEIVSGDQDRREELLLECHPFDLGIDRLLFRFVGDAEFLDAVVARVIIGDRRVTVLVFEPFFVLGADILPRDFHVALVRRQDLLHTDETHVEVDHVVVLADRVNVIHIGGRIHRQPQDEFLLLLPCPESQVGRLGGGEVVIPCSYLGVVVSLFDEERQIEYRSRVGEQHQRLSPVGFVIFQLDRSDASAFVRKADFHQVVLDRIESFGSFGRLKKRAPEVAFEGLFGLRRPEAVARWRVRHGDLFHFLRLLNGCRIGGVQRIDERFGFVELRLLFTVVPRKTEEYDTDDQ